MIKEWYIEIDGVKEGPYTLNDLKTHPKLTPDSLVWKMGFIVWTPARNVPELKKIFEDDIPLQREEDLEEDTLISAKKKALSGNDEMTMALRFDPPSFYFLIFIVIIVILYTFYQIYSHM